jgi:hypothetical protein
MKGSWRTTVAGILLSIAGVATAGHTLLTSGDMDRLILAVTSLVGGLGLAAARDNKVSSEEAGAR